MLDSNIGNDRFQNKREKTHNESDYTDFSHTGPGTLAGRYLRIFWQPIYRSEDLPAGIAKPVRILSEDFTLYRGEDGSPYLIQYRCPHRGTQLSVGSIEGNSIRCAFHGWKFDGSGQCLEQPGEPEPFSNKVRIRSFHTRDYLGLIFAYIGEEEPPQFPTYPDIENFQGTVLVYPNYTRSCNYFQNIENGLDPVHQVFAHSGAVGSPTTPPMLRVEESSWGITGYIDFGDGKHGVQYLGMPNIQRIRILPSDPEISSLYEALIYKVPVDDENHLQFMIIGIPMQIEGRERVKQQIIERCKPRPELVSKILSGKLRLKDANKQEMLNQDLIWLQDDVVQIGQGVMANRSEEMLGASDVGIKMIRQIWERELHAFAKGRQLKQWTYMPIRFN